MSAALRTMLAHTEACDRERLRDLRRAIAQRIDADIALLDRLGGDPDLEPQGDDEPALGSLDRMAQTLWSAGSPDDREMGDDTGIGDSLGLAEQVGRRLRLIAGGAA